MTLLFELGHQPKLSIAEIEAVLSMKKIAVLNAKQLGNAYLVETKDAVDAAALMNTLGGTVSIAEKIDSSIVEHLQSVFPDGKIHFSVQGPNARDIAKQAKRELKELGRSVRYIEAKNTATILHNNLVEKQSNIVLNGKGMFVTRAIQPIEQMSKRDFDKPGFDTRSGMLPPKLARMMINLGEKENANLLDPFCGSGVLLMEAALLGQTVYGSDISEKAAEDSKKNMAWIQKQADVRLGDARDVHNMFADKKIDLIVTEPYMGKPLRGSERKDALQEQARELRTLFVDAFRSFVKLLEKDARVVFIIPRFQFENDWVIIDCASDIESLGFSQYRESLLYHRKKQHVGRELFFFQKD